MSDDGRFYAEDGMVWRSPRSTKTPTGERISLGFPVCTPHEALGPKGAETLANTLNKAIDLGIIPNKDDDK